MGETTAQLAITGASAFVGALSAVGVFGYWFATKLNRIYERIGKVKEELKDDLADHKLADEREFGLLRAQIAGALIQSQAVTAAVKSHGR